MSEITLRFYEELNDFLPRNRRKTDFKIRLGARRTIRDMIESLAVPHTEIDLILVNGKSVDFDHILQNKDRVSVYPVFESFNIKDVTLLRKAPLRRPKFLADTNLGNIVDSMRLMGFDVYYNPLLSTRKLIEISKRENRIILTVSRKLLKFKDVTHGILIHPGKTSEQIRQIIDHLDIKDRIKPFSRYLRSNTQL
jgi:sulfur carrier protein ThiS